MKNPWLLSLAPLLLAVSSSLPLSAAVRPVSLGFPAAGQSPVECIGDGVYAANSTYQANLHRLAALLTAEVDRACPYRREASFSDGNCTLELEESRIFGPAGGIFEGNILKQAMASGLVFQAIGFGCLFFLLFQEWRSRKRGTLTHSTPLLSGD